MEYYASLIRYLERAKELIVAETVPDNQIALIILDNTVELVMRRQLREEFFISDQYQIIYDSYLQAFKGKPDKSVEQEVERIEPMLISREQRKELKKCFHKKVQYFAEKNLIDKNTVGILNFLHEYRNKIYHEGVRLEITKSINYIYFNVVCRLLKAFPLYSFSYPIIEDYKKIYTKYDVQEGGFSKQVFVRILDTILGDLVLEPEAFRRHLVKNMTWRVEDVFAGLDFIYGNGGLSSVFFPNKDLALKHLISTADSHGSFFGDCERRNFVKYKDDYSMAYLETLRKDIRHLADVKEDDVFLGKFLSFESKFVPLEILVANKASIVEEDIQLGVDMALGK